MTRFLADLRQSLSDLAPLIDSVRKAASGDAAFTYTQIGAGLIKPAVGGVIILLVARLEDYIKSIIEASLDQYDKCHPPVLRHMLSDELSFKLIRENLQASWQENVHGTRRSVSARLAHVNSVVTRAATGEVWAGDAISTSGNPGPETIKGLLKLIGFSNPWTLVEAEFSSSWQRTLSSNPHYKSIPSASAELLNLIGWRNIVAHTSGTLSIGPGELDEEVAFVDSLCSSLDTLICAHIDNSITQLGSTPANWP